MARKPRTQPAAVPKRGVGVTVRRPTVGIAATKTAGKADSPNISYLRSDLAIMLPLYHLIRDCLMGEFFIKQHDRWYLQGQHFSPFGMSEYDQSNVFGYGSLPYIRQYLPQPNSADKSAENSARYSEYIGRAVFYDVAQHTLGGLVGAVFLRAPVIELPTELEALRDDVTGGGVSLIQFGKQCCRTVLAYGRAGMLVDFPSVDGPVTVADRAAGTLRPTVQLYAPWSVINWRTRWIGGLQRLSLVVIAEISIIADDGFKETTGEQYRVLELLPDGTYQSSLWRRDDAGTRDAGGNGFMVAFARTIPTDATGKPFDYIPFTFVGPEDNGPSVDHPPLSGLAALNIAHYRNSADYEEAAYLVGQPTPVFSGLTEQWVSDVLGGKIELGSRAAVALPITGKAELLQAEPNLLPLEAMRHKEQQMAALGAKLTEEKRIQRTATEAGFDEAAQQSVLASSAANAGQAILWALQQCCAFEGVSYTDATLKFELNTEFDLVKPSPESRKQLLTEWEASAISFSEYRHNMRRSGITVLDDDAAMAEIKANPPPAVAAQLVEQAIQKAATNDKTAP